MAITGVVVAGVLLILAVTVALHTAGQEPGRPCIHDEPAMGGTEASPAKNGPPGHYEKPKAVKNICR